MFSRLSLFALSCLLLGCLGGSDPADGGPDSPECFDDTTCDDGVYCNGDELCREGACVPGTARCPGACDEELDRCEGCTDADRDGFQDAACGGDDCDDDDPGRNPGRTEVCDIDNRDEDCDPRTVGFRDADMDGEGDALCCNDDGGTLRCGLDCDDMRPNVNSSAGEVCDGRDNDCDGSVDEGVLETFYPDGDGDGFGVESGPVAMACSPPEGYVAQAGDCNDELSEINPGVPERCVRPAPGEEAVDDDCDGMRNEDCDCTEGETQPCLAPGLCGSGVTTCDSGTWSDTCSVTPEVDTTCDGVDADCDSRTDEGLLVVCYVDDDNDTYATNTTRVEICPVGGREAVGGCPPGYTNRPGAAGEVDCDDTRSNVRPGGTEVCVEGTTARNEDCDANVDEGVAATCYPDSDGDGYAPLAAGQQRCTVGGREAFGGCPPGTTNRRPTATTDDCDDSAFGVNPTATEVCDAGGVDEDCDGVANPMAQCQCVAGDDRPCSEGGLLGPCAAGRQSCSGGRWGACSMPPGAETSCNGVDDDCDGRSDEGFTVVCYDDLDGDGFAPAGAAARAQCSCGPASRSTNRAPSGADVDCNDGNGTVHPGAPEVCDRIDNDCSAGGGAEIGEDADNDGFAPVGATWCMGGFPRTDCRDGDGNVHPEQTAYFSTGYCVRRLSGGACIQYSWDFNCDGRSDPESAGACVGNGDFGSGCVTAAQCLPRGGPAVTETDSRCGVPVPHVSSCACGTTQRCAIRTTDQLLKCR